MDALPQLLVLLPDKEAEALSRACGAQAHCRRIDAPGLGAALDGGGWSALVTDEGHGRGLLGRPDLPPLLLLYEELAAEAVQELLAAGVFAVLRRGRLDYLANVLSRLPPPDRRRAVDRQQGFLRELYDNIGEVFWLLDSAHWRMLYLSPAYQSIWERPADAPMRNLGALLDTVHPDDFGRVQACLEAHGWAGFDLDYRILLPDGETRWIATRSFPIRDAENRLLRVAGVSRDITEAKRLELESRTLSRAVEQTADAVMVTNAEGLIDYVNPAFEEITGYGREEVLGHNPSLLKSGLQDEGFYRQVWRSLTNGIPYSDIFINRRKDGDLYYESKTITPVRDDDGVITHFVATGKDITARLKEQERLRRIVHYDAVTGLASRILLEERLERAILQARRQTLMIGVFYIDLELGELLGGGAQRGVSEQEQLLRLVAQRLQEVASEGDTVGQLEGERFVILHKYAEQRRQIEEAVQALVAAFAEPIRAEGYELFLSPNIGVSCYPQDGDSTTELLRHAEEAVAEVRGQGAGRYRFYHAGESDRRGGLSN